MRIARSRPDSNHNPRPTPRLPNGRPTATCAAPLQARSRQRIANGRAADSGERNQPEGEASLAGGRGGAAAPCALPRDAALRPEAPTERRVWPMSDPPRSADIRAGRAEDRRTLRRERPSSGEIQADPNVKQISRALSHRHPVQSRPRADSWGSSKVNKSTGAPRGRRDSHEGGEPGSKRTHAPWTMPLPKRTTRSASPGSTLPPPQTRYLYTLHSMPNGPNRYPPTGGGWATTGVSPQRNSRE